KARTTNTGPSNRSKRSSAESKAAPNRCCSTTAGTRRIATSRRRRWKRWRASSSRSFSEPRLRFLELRGDTEEQAFVVVARHELHADRQSWRFKKWHDHRRLPGEVGDQ